MTVIEALQELELGIRAGPKEVRAAFRKLSKRWHPDHIRGGAAAKASAQQRFLKIRDAYQLLTENPRFLRGGPPRTGRRTGPSRGREFQEYIRRYRAQHAARPSRVYAALARSLNAATLPERLLAAGVVIGAGVLFVAALLGFWK